jgi:hypothetical protein
LAPFWVWGYVDIIEVQFLLDEFKCSFDGVLRDISVQRMPAHCHWNYQRYGFISPTSTSQAVKILSGMQCMLSSVMTDSTEAWNPWPGSFDRFDIDGRVLQGSIFQE